MFGASPVRARRKRSSIDCNGTSRGGRTPALRPPGSLRSIALVAITRFEKMARTDVFTLAT